ncbi:MAG TPA: phosphatase PAP2 family protein [Rhodothermales bacterium]|nr:phosphatase PAP2 family protein [Rhodothermales bacterium]
MRGWLSDDAGTLHRGRLALVLAGIYALFWATYISINVFSVGRPAHTLFLPGEERLPFLPVFEYLYVLTCFVPGVLIVSVRTYAQFVRLVLAFAIALLVAYTTYLVFPVYMERPALEVTSLHTWLLSLHYLDKPYNHFPSMHVTLSWLVVHSAQGSRRFRLALALTAVGISISTLFVKQHYLVDVVYGYTLAWGAWKLAALGASKRVMVPTGASTTSAAQ